MKHVTLAILPLIAALTACGGSSTSDAVFIENAFAFATIEEGITNYNDLSIAAGSISPFEDLPQTGTARYDGMMVIVVDDPAGRDAVFGTARINADLDTNQFEGQASSFFGLRSREAAAGSLDILDGAFANSGTAPGFARVTGKIAFLGVDMEIDGTASVNFYGDAGSFSVGTVTGTAQSATGPVIPLGDSRWVVERQ